MVFFVFLFEAPLGVPGGRVVIVCLCFVKWTEFAVVMGCVLFGMHFSQSKNALLLNFTYLNGGIDTTGQMLFVYAMGKFLRWNCQWLGKYRSLIHLCVL